MPNAMPAAVPTRSPKGHEPASGLGGKQFPPYKLCLERTAPNHRFQKMIPPAAVIQRVSSNNLM
jgi:hypothetical protein